MMASVSFPAMTLSMTSRCPERRSRKPKVFRRMRLNPLPDLRCMHFSPRKRCTSADRCFTAHFLQEQSAVALFYPKSGFTFRCRTESRSESHEIQEGAALQTECRMRLQGDRVRMHTAAAVLRRIDDETVDR